MKSKFAGLWRKLGRARLSRSGINVGPPVRSRRATIEVLESRRMLANDLPRFLFEWDVEAREYKPNVPVPDLWGFRDQGLGTEVSVATGPHAYRSEFLRYGGDQEPIRTRPDGFSSAALQVTESGRQASVHFTSRHELHYSAVAERHLIQAVVEHRMTLQIYIRGAVDTRVNQRVALASDRVVLSEGMAVRVNGTTGDLFVDLFPAETERHQSRFDVAQPTHPIPLVHEGVDYFPLTHRISFYTSTSFFRTHTSTTPPGETVSSADVRAAADVVVTVSLDEIEGQPLFTAPRVLGLGKTLVLDATPTTVTWPVPGSLVFRWYARPSNGDGVRQPIGTGQVVSYAYHEQTVFGELGDYELILDIEDGAGTVRSVSRTLTIQMDFLDVVFHGWIPLESQTAETRQVFNEYADRLRDFAHSRELPAGSSHQAGSMNWDSHTGFTLAFISRLAAEVASAHSRPDIRVLGTTYFMGLYRWFHRQAKMRAEQAASQAAAQIVASLAPLLQDPDRSFAVHLIGHSRGGYVASRASEILARRHAVPTCYLTVLDGYADDWPGFAASFADGSIVGTATAGNGVNLLVEQDLTEWALDTFVTWVRSTIETGATTFLPMAASQAFAAVPATEIEAAIRRRVEAWDWRAPQRAGAFGTNAVVVGTPDSGPSNHLNIHEIYFGDSQTDGQVATDSTSEWLAVSPLGDPRSCVLSADETSLERTGDSQRIRQTASISASDFARFASIRDFAREHQSIFEGHEPWLNTFVELLATDGYLESVLFGNDRITLGSDTAEPSGLKLSAERSLELLLEHPQATLLQLTLRAESLAQPGDVFLYLDGERFDTITIDRLGEQTWSRPLPVDADPQGPLLLGLSLGDGDADLRLQSVALIGGQGDAEFRVDPSVAIRGQAEGFRFTIAAAGKGPVAEIERVEFFMPLSAGIGPTIGADPIGNETLRHLGDGTREGDQWTLNVSAESFDLGVTNVYASLSFVDGASIWQVADLELLTARSPLTNHSRPLDVNRDGEITGLDALLVVNLLARASHESVDMARSTLLPDTNGDGFVTALDALLIINSLARRSAAADGEGEAVPAPRLRHPAANVLLARPTSRHDGTTAHPDGVGRDTPHRPNPGRSGAGCPLPDRSCDHFFATTTAFLAPSRQRDLGASPTEADRLSRQPEDVWEVADWRPLAGIFFPDHQG